MINVASCHNHGMSPFENGTWIPSVALHVEGMVIKVHWNVLEVHCLATGEWLWGVVGEVGIGEQTRAGR